ncbi:MAG: hypothetical protein AAFO07_27090 [Bacteroidota bacterium]
MLNPATLNLDTHKVVKLLKERGYSEEAAEGFIEAIQEITLSGIATKQDLYEFQAMTVKEFQDTRNEIREETQDLKTEIAGIKGQLTALEARFGVFQWAMGIHMAMTIAILIKLFS